MNKSIFILGGSILALAACDGAPNEGGGNSANAYAFDTYLQGGVSFAQLTLDALPDGLATSLTDRGDLPAGGSAIYDGVIFVELDNGTDDDVFGTVRLTAGFSGNSLTGTAGSFVNDNDQAVDGSLSISNGTFLAAGPVLGTADVSGTVEFNAGTMVVGGEATHGFTGDTGEYNFGSVLDGSAQPAIGGPIDVDITWVAERQ